MGEPTASTTTAGTSPSTADAEADAARAQGWRRFVPDHDGWVTIGIAYIALAAVVVVNRWWYPNLQLDLASYREPSMIVAALTDPVVLLTSVIPASVVVVWHRQLSWADLGSGRELRVVVVAAAVPIALAFSLYQPNWYLEQLHLFDRFALVVLFGLLVWRPVWLIPFVITSVVISSQFTVGVGSYTVTDKRPVIDALVVMAALVASGFAKRRDALSAFALAAGAILGAWYVRAGWLKLRMDWLQGERIDLLVRATRVAGWLPEGLSDRVGDAVGHANGLFVVLTLLVEMGFVLYFVGRRWAFGLLIVEVGLHAMVFLTSGILFWKWMVFDAALAFALWRTPRESLRAFRPLTLLVFLPFLVVAPRVLVVSDLAWHDTPYIVDYELELVGPDGEVSGVRRSTMEPYDVIFAQNRFEFLVRDPTLVRRGHVEDPDVAEQLIEADGPDEIARIEAEHGTVAYDPVAARRFDHAIRARFDGPVRKFPIAPPNHIITGRAHGSAPERDLDSVVAVQVRVRKFLWDGSRLRLLKTCVPRKIWIDPRTPTVVAPEGACLIDPER